MLTETDAWRRVVAAWPPPRDWGTLARLPPEEARRVRSLPFPDLTPLADAAQSADMEALCAAVAANATPDASMAHNVLFLLTARASALVTPAVLSGWLRAIAVVHAPEIQRWFDEESDEAALALYEQFLSRVPVGVAFEELLEVMGPPTDYRHLGGEEGYWATYSGEEHGFQIWGDTSGRYCADKCA